MKTSSSTRLDQDIAADIVALLGIEITPEQRTEMEAVIARRRTASPVTNDDLCRVALGRVMNRHASQVLFHDGALAELCWDALASTPVIETTVRRCARIAGDACLVEPDGGSPTEEETAVANTASSRIMGILGPKLHPLPSFLKTAA